MIRILVFQFNQFTLDTVQYRLCPSGVAIPVEPQVFDLLDYLIKNRGRIISRDELLDNLWKGKVVTDAALGVCLKDVRKAVGDIGDRQSVIKTFHGRGYQFIAEVTESGAEKMPDKENQSTLGKTLALPDKPSVAVMPFTNMSNDPEQDFFADGVTEDIITELSRERDLFVIARNSTFAYKDRSPDLGQVAQELGVKFVLEGSVRKADGRIRLNAQLINAQNNSHVWAERYDRALEDVFEVQDELTRTISNTLLQKLREAETERALRQTPQSIAAYDHYLRAFGLVLNFTKAGNTAAIVEAHRALEIDPDYGRVYMILAWAYAHRTSSGWTDDPESEIALSREAALKAVNFDANDFWGHAALSHAELFAGNHDRSLNAINRAVALNPNSADSHALRGIVLNFVGAPVEALDEMELAIRLNPNHPTWYFVGLGRACYGLGKYEQAIPYLEPLVNAGSDVLAWRALLIVSYMAAGRADQARAEVSALLAARPDVRCRNVLAVTPYRDEETTARYTELLKSAGLPD
jgi:TolB-like protein/Tfp pilus assembly protein PilF